MLHGLPSLAYIDIFVSAYVSRKIIFLSIIADRAGLSVILCEYDRFFSLFCRQGVIDASQGDCHIVPAEHV